MTNCSIIVDFNDVMGWIDRAIHTKYSIYDEHRVRTCATSYLLGGISRRVSVLH